MHPFKLTVRVDNICMNHFITLDATIAGILYGNSTMEGELDLPFATRNGIPLASYPIFETQLKTTTSVTNSAARYIMHHGLPSCVTKGSSDGITGPSARSYHRGSASTVYVPKNGLITYYATGDARYIAELFERTGSIGAWTGKGFGTLLPFPRTGLLTKITKVEGTDIGIYDENGALVRPIPISEAINIPDYDYSRAMGRYANPYNPANMRRFGYSPELIAIPKFANNA